MKKFMLLLMLTAMLLGVTGCSGGAEKKVSYPADGEITVIIPKAPGGGTDVSARGLL